MTTMAHPLFLNDNDEEPPEVGFIHIVRWERGQKFQVPKAYQAEELTSLEQIREMFGGGHYELIARDFNNKISRRIRVNLPGALKPLDQSESEDEPEDNSENYPKAKVPENPFPVDGIMGMFMHSMTTQMQMQAQNMQMQMQMQAQQAEAARQQAAEQTKMMIAMMQSQPKQDMTPLFVAMMQNSAEMFKVLMSKGGGSASEALDAIKIGVDLVKGSQEGSGPKPGSAEEMIQTFLGGLQALKTQGAPSPGSFPPGFAPPGFAPPAQEYPPQQVAPPQPAPRRRRVVQVAPDPANTAGVAEVGGEKETGT